ncbi:MAG: hypothetical protein QM572_14715 [Nocardioides sp.]|uniref:hypothetical protein n=1 Tax=Nocardioides sp. TaxID=35761 RepID=UPI0039E52D31
MSFARIVLVPGVLALKPELASLSDPVPELRRAVLAALEWVGPSPVVAGDAQGVVAALGHGHLGWPAPPRRADVAVVSGEGLVVVGNGSAKRSERAPGHFDERAAGFDDWLREALTVEPGLLADLDVALAEDLWADVGALPVLARELGEAGLVSVDYDDDPYGVKYWVMRWEVSDDDWRG